MGITTLFRTAPLYCQTSMCCLQVFDDIDSTCSTYTVIVTKTCKNSFVQDLCTGTYKKAFDFSVGLPEIKTRVWILFSQRLKTEFPVFVDVLHVGLHCLDVK